MMDEGWGVKLEDRGVGFRFRVLGVGFQVPGSICPGCDVPVPSSGCQASLNRGGTFNRGLWI